MSRRRVGRAAFSVRPVGNVAVVAAVARPSANIMEKLELHTRLQIAAFAHEHDIVDPDAGGS